MARAPRPHRLRPRARRAAHGAALLTALLASPAATAAAQEVASAITPVSLSAGRSFPITTPAPIARVSVANPEVADVVVVSERELVINAKAAGETDAIVWVTGAPRRHYRVNVLSSGDRLQVVLYVRFAEVRRDVAEALGVNVLYRDQSTRVGTNNLRGDARTTRDSLGRLIYPLSQTRNFLTVLSSLGTDNLIAILEAEESKGNARTLAEPNVMASNREWGTFHAGGELPIPLVTGAPVNGFQAVTIFWRPFGVRLRFMGEVLNDSIIHLTDTLEVSDLDYTNAVELSGFRVPALRTRSVQSTLDVRRNQSLIISGLFNNSSQYTRTGVPLLKDIPILGLLFSSTQWQRNETELIVIVTPVLVDPMRPRGLDLPAPGTGVDTSRTPATDALSRPRPGGVPPKP